MTSERLRALQLTRLQATLAATATRDGLDHRREDSVQRLEDLDSLPFTTKTDLQTAPPLRFLSVPVSEVRRFHASSGTGGRPVVVAYDEADLENWAQLTARALTAAGASRGTVVHIAYGYGLFTGGLGMHDGAQRIGASVVPASGGATSRQVKLLSDLGAKVLCCTPSYAVHLSETIAASQGRFALEVGLFGAEPWSVALRETLEARLGLKALNIYGLSEMYGPGVAFECRHGAGLSHVQEDHFLAEVVDPQTDRPLPDGTEGELVLTSLTKSAMPLVRFRTGDITALVREPCACGRTFVRMTPVRDRVDDMLTIRGVNVFPSEIEAVVASFAELAPWCQIVVRRPAALDELSVRCELVSDSPVDAGLAKAVGSALRERTAVRMSVDVRPPGTLPRTDGKRPRIVDERELDQVSPVGRS